MSEYSSSASSLRDLVFETLQKDAACRQVGVADEHLREFADLQFNRQWDYSLPTLVKETTYSKVGVERPTLEAYKRSFYSTFPELETFDFSNVLIAGGCPGHFLYSNAKFDGDVDMFVYGLDRKDADRRVCKIIKDLVSSYKKHAKRLAQKNQGDARTTNPPKDKTFYVRMVRNGNGMTLFLNEHEYGGRLRKYQIIFRLYSSKSEILHGFDVGSSAVGFDGSTLYFTALSRFSHEFRCNIVDTTRRSTTYETRLKKYWERGYELILPHFDMQKVRKEYLRYNVAEMVIMPHLVLTYNAVHGCQIVVSNFVTRFRSSSDASDETKTTDGEGDRQQSSKDEQDVTDYALEDVDEYNLLFINMRHLLTDPKRMYHFHEFAASTGTLNGDEDELIEKFFERPPFLSVKSIDYFYRTFRNKVYYRKRLLVAQLQKYITVETTESIVQRILIDHENSNVVLDNVVEAQRKHVLALLEEHAKNTRSIPWITENPGTQLTSSINPIFEEPAEWYGEYYNPSPNKRRKTETE